MATLPPMHRWHKVTRSSAGLSKTCKHFLKYTMSEITAPSTCPHKLQLIKNKHVSAYRYHIPLMHRRTYFQIALHIPNYHSGNNISTLLKNEHIVNILSPPLLHTQTHIWNRVSLYSPGCSGLKLKVFTCLWHVSAGVTDVYHCLSLYSCCKSL